ncbi:hypothetical protein SmJEL517_g00721 [Synchytrium microbalum]|uniref:Alpha/beta hydrolase fold-3 domain-containing protein n=1 Tax=Synchytrium microbalum TaxID=1806994 RepID=A0A507C7F6_9FUNG|nr:uncharacterized protein SmJEL517_g00721 [Synchytrium microbalum]TPX37500.1 hypothetical protein SmJEL517_g00721 [Synchytrium microbalum]
MSGTPRIYPASWSDELRKEVALLHASRSLEQAYSNLKNPARTRKAIEEMMYFPLPAGVDVESVSIPRVATPGLDSNPQGKIAAEWLAPAGKLHDASLPVVLYLHGGAYVWMSPKTHRIITAKLALKNIRVLSVDYRMGPEEPFPAAVVDAFSAYKFLLAEKIDLNRVVISGAGLTVALMLYLRDRNETYPAGWAPLTPWIDLRCDAPSEHIGQEFRCDVVERDLLLPNVHAYTGGDNGLNATNHLVSPILDLGSKGRQFPPIWLSTGTTDSFLAETIYLALTRLQSSESVHLLIYEDLFHAFQLRPGASAAADNAIERQCDFIKTVTSGGTLKIKNQLTSLKANTFEEVTLSAADVKNTLKKLIDRADAISKRDYEPYRQMANTSDATDNARL